VSSSINSGGGRGGTEISMMSGAWMSSSLVFLSPLHSAESLFSSINSGGGRGFLTPLLGLLVSDRRLFLPFSLLRLLALLLFLSMDRDLEPGDSLEELR